MELKNKVALITGAGQRIGRAIALRLAESGCHIAIHYRTSAGEAEQTAGDCRRAGARAELFQADLAESEQVGGLVSRVVDSLGRLDVLVNNAAVFERMSIDDFLDVLLKVPRTQIHILLVGRNALR